MAARVLTALFDDRETAAAAVGKLEAAGVPRADIGVVSKGAGEAAAAPSELPPADAPPAEAPLPGAGEGAGTGATVGTVIGGGAGLLAGLGLLAIPGLGPVVAAGWLVAAVTGAGVGAAAGGLVGGLTGAGLGPEDAAAYAEGVRRGGTLLTVRADDGRADQVLEILGRAGSIDIDERAEGWRAQGWTGAAAPERPDAEAGRSAAPSPGPTQTFGATER